MKLKVVFIILLIALTAGMANAEEEKTAYQ